jgi:hypothetical protein
VEDRLYARRLAIVIAWIYLTTPSIASLFYLHVEPSVWAVIITVVGAAAEAFYSYWEEFKLCGEASVKLFQCIWGLVVDGLGWLYKRLQECIAGLNQLPERWRKKRITPEQR